MAAKKRSQAHPVEEISDSKETAAQVVDEKAVPGFPIVGIGASAGGLAAFETFFSAMPADIGSDMAFVLVQHLAPDYKSILSELVRRYTRMQVLEVEDGMMVKANCVYIIPPNRDMAYQNGTLQLMEPQAPRGHRLPIDFFFRSLAQDQHEWSIVIVLSGNGSDGTIGVRDIKGEGGMVMAQQPESTEYDSMPRNAIATGLVDYVLPAAEMPANLINYVAHAYTTHAYTTHAFNKEARPVYTSPPKVEDTLKKIFILLRERTGHDFSQYKSNTINRRVSRRMALQQIQGPEEYVRYLQQTPAEVEALFRDFLIGVTSFFRDTEAFAALQEIGIPQLFADKSDNDRIRVWAPACSTGEEAYSIAILLQEYIESHKKNYELQVFATDIDGEAVNKARAGIYPSNIAADISPERLSRFFTRDPDEEVYRIRKGIRDMLIFSEQDVVKDPPFSKINLISCRNLLIYMNSDLQKKILTLFHYSLNPGGLLFLGKSETVGQSQEFFTSLDRQSKLYQRKELDFQARHPEVLKHPPTLTENFAVLRPAGPSFREKVPVQTITEQALLEKYAPSSALVNEFGDILYIHGRTGRYLEPAFGEPGMSNILKMAREGLQRELSLALQKAATQKETVERRGVQVKTNGDFTAVNLTVQPVTAREHAVAGSNLFLVILEDAPEEEPTPADKTAGLDAGMGRSASETDALIVELQKKLKAKEEYLQNTKEELEASDAERKTSNEELQSLNEELQSTNEELETSKEELQSVNEELATVNGELQAKVTDLSRVNNDMTNLLSATGVGIVFVDLELRIQRFTSAITQVINLIPTDVGRPIGHVLSKLVGYDSLVEDIQAVLENLTPREAEVQTKAGIWFMLRIRPYRTLGNVIEGAVISFFDIAEMKRVAAALRDTESKYRVLFETMPQGVVFQDREGKSIEANPAAARILGSTVDRMKGFEFIGPEWSIVCKDGADFPLDELPGMVAIRTGKAVEGVVIGIHRPRKKGVTWLSVNSIPLFKPGEGTPYQVYTTFDDITETLSAG